MKLITLALLLSCGQVVAQKNADKEAPIATRGTKSSSYPVFINRADKDFKFVGVLPDSTITIRGTDSLGAIKILLKNLQESQQKEQQLRDAFQKAVTFSNTVPQIYKSSKEWKEYLAVMKKLGYEVIKK